MSFSDYSLAQLNDAIASNERVLRCYSISPESTETIIRTVAALKRERTRRWVTSHIANQVVVDGIAAALDKY